VAAVIYYVAVVFKIVTLNVLLDIVS